MSLHDKLLALADEGNATEWKLNRHALALAVYKMALEDAAREFDEFSYGPYAHPSIRIRALKETL